MATNFRVKIGKIGLFTFIRGPGIPKRIAISPFGFFKKFTCKDLATLFVGLKMANVGPVTPEFNRVKGVNSFLISNLTTSALVLELQDRY